MRRDLAIRGAARPAVGRCARSLACLGFVVALGVAFWAGAVWIAQGFMAPGAGSF